MAITDIISEEIETRAPNLEVAQGGPEDFMSEDEMDPYQDPEFQQLLESLPTEQAEVLIQLIKEFKMAVAQGFTGEFEDFVKMKMASAQGSSEDLMTEEEMIIPDEELQSMIPMGQQAAHGGRIRRQGGGIMDVVEEEQVETGPTTQQLIMKWLNDRGLPITPENIQRAIMELSQAGQAPSMPRGEMVAPQMEQPRPPTGALAPGVVGEDISETVTPDIARMMSQAPAEEVVSEAEIIPQAKPEDAVYSDEEMREMKQKYIEQGGTLDSGIEDEVEETGIMQTTDPIFYSDDEEPYTRDMFKESANVLTRGMYGMPDSREYLQEEIMDRINRYKRHNPDVTDEEIHEILRREKNSVSDLLRQQSAKGVPFTLAHGGRARYGLGSLVKGIFKGAKKGVKSLVKSVKKFAKSDLGKMALMYITKGAGTGWLRPGTVLSNYGNLFKGADKVTAASDALTSGSQYSPIASMGYNPNLSTLAKGKEIADKGGMFSGLLGSFEKNPMPWILGTSAAAGLYTKMNPGDDNLEEMMRNYKGEVADWDQRIADIRAGKIKTPFSTDNIDFPYPDYYKYSAEGGRIGRAEGGLMDLGGMEKDYRAEGGFVPIGGKEKADDVPARLSRNEFVFTADAVRNAGGGDVDRGSEVMENIMTNLENGGNISEESQGLEGARDMFEVSERLSEVV